MAMDRSEFGLTWRILDDKFQSNRASRHCFGTGISSYFKDENGCTFDASGLAKLDSPVPFLLEHNELRPLGKVVGVNVRGDAMTFHAEFTNSDKLYWANQVWEKLLTQTATGISIAGVSLDPLHDKTFRRWRLKEISLVGDGADPNAVIHKVWERLPYVYCDGRSSVTVHWERQHDATVLPERVAS